MKHGNNSNRYLVPQNSSVCDLSPLVCDHRPALKEIAREQSLVTQLRAIVLPALQADERAELVAHIFESILDCSRKVMSELQLQPGTRADDVPVDDKRRVRKVRRISVDCSKEEIGKPHRRHKRGRFGDSVSVETPVPHYDGHQWRKYGQKHINNAKHPRSYYRCTYRQEQDCKATKTVQQHDDGKSSADHPAMYAVVYYGQHTCHGDNIDGEDAAPDVVETAISNQSRSSGGDHAQSNSQGSVSVTCSVADDHQTSLDSELLDIPDLTTEVNQYELFDVTAYAPLDLGTWEMDAHGHGLVNFGDW